MKFDKKINAILVAIVLLLIAVDRRPDGVGNFTFLVAVLVMFTLCWHWAAQKNRPIKMAEKEMKNRPIEMDEIEKANRVSGCCLLIIIVSIVICMGVIGVILFSKDFFKNLINTP